ncbi:MAG: hypothetical protein HFE64_00265 [Lachnospiraceae bacterium]|nr:hypothetical protein [Lachnospiraceae bacterium]
MTAENSTLIIYNSRYGSTKQYAEWLMQQRECDCLQAKEVKLSLLRPYRNLIWMGNVKGEQVEGLDRLQKVYAKLKDQRVAIFAVGAAPDGSRIVVPGELSELPFFYARGKWDPAALKGMDQMMIKMLKLMASKKPEEVPDWQKDMLESEEAHDFMDSAYLEPLLDFIAGRA